VVKRNTLACPTVKHIDEVRYNLRHVDNTSKISATMAITLSDFLIRQLSDLNDCVT